MNTRLPLVAAALTCAAGLLGIRPVHADPCGMVPPVYVGADVPIARIGVQQTYVFHRDGVETFVIRPGFQGQVEEFGMLIPMPAVPALRKVSDNVFPHVAAAIDPPEIVVYARQLLFRSRKSRSAGQTVDGLEYASRAKKDEVRVLKEEAVGMYEVAVLAAGSAKALNKWMDDHGYQYPRGMDAACEDYIEDDWCFVAVKTKVGQKKGVDPQPGMRTTQPDRPEGSTFDGHVQAMGFRFPAEELVVPMRLSTFNEGDLRNVVYVLADEPLKIRSIPGEYVVRQVAGEELLKHVTEPLPLRVVGGTVEDLQEWQTQNLPQQRDPEPHNGAAKQLFASDLLAVKEGRLVHPHEETEKMLLRIGERLDLRGPEIDALNEEALKSERDETVAAGLQLLEGMTLTVVDGNFPREVLANQNLRFAAFRMPARRNSATLYDAKTFGPAPEAVHGTLYEGKLSENSRLRSRDPLANALPRGSASSQGDTSRTGTPWRLAGMGLLSGLLVGVLTLRRRSR